MKLRPRGRHKGRAGSARSRSKSRTRQRIGLSSDAIQEALYVLRDSADVLPPLKSAVGGVLAIWNLVDRVHSSDEEARALAWKTVEILDAIYNAVDNDPGAIPHGLLQNILKFEKLLKEISDVMDACLKAGRLRRLVLLRKHESRLAQFNWQLDGVSEAFKIGALTRVELAVGRIPENLPSTTALAKVLEQSNTRLHSEIKALRSVVLFGLSPMSPLYNGALCVHGATLPMYRSRGHDSWLAAGGE